MSSTPLTSCSIGVATVSAMTSGEAPGIGGPHDDRRRHDLRVLSRRQSAVGDRAENDDDDRNHARENGPIDKKVGESHNTNSILVGKNVAKPQPESPFAPRKDVLSRSERRHLAATFR